MFSSVFGLFHLISSSKFIYVFTNGRISIWSSSPTSSYIFKRIEIRILKRYLHPYVHCSSMIHNNQEMEATSVSIYRSTDKEKVAYTYTGMLLLRKAFFLNEMIF